jgi:hypothetical protein
LAQWNKQGGLTCEECGEKGLVELGIVTCDECKKPRPLESNYTVLTLYSYQPIRPIPMTDGLVMLDIPAVKFLMEIYDIPHEEKCGILERMIIYHNNLYNKKHSMIGEEKNDLGKENK